MSRFRCEVLATNTGFARVTYRRRLLLLWRLVGVEVWTEGRYFVLSATAD